MDQTTRCTDITKQLERLASDRCLHPFTMPLALCAGWAVLPDAALTCAPPQAITTPTCVPGPSWRRTR